MDETKPIPYSGYMRNGYIVITGPNKANPTLADGAVVATDICLMALDRKLAVELLNVLVDELPPATNTL